MSTNEPDSSHKLVDMIKPSEGLSALLQNAVTETRSRAISLKTFTVMTPLQPLPSSIETVLTEFPSIESVLKEFSDTGSEVTLKRLDF